MGATTTEIATNHVAMVSHPDDVVTMIQTAATARPSRPKRKRSVRVRLLAVVPTPIHVRPRPPRDGLGRTVKPPDRSRGAVRVRSTAGRYLRSSLRALGDRADELAGPLVLLERDVSLRDHADESAVLDNGEPPNLVTGHQLECLVEVVVGLDTDQVARVDVPD
jgi:hypothetical protein